MRHETVAQAVKRLGDGWATSQRLDFTYRRAYDFARAIQRPDLIDAMIMRMRSFKQ